MNSERDFDSAKKRALDFLSRRNHSSFEIVRKLKERGFSQSACSQVVSYLHEIGLLDDHRFIRQWSRFRFDLHNFGPMRLRSELLEKGLPATEVDLFINNLPDEWASERLAEQALLRRYKDTTVLKTLKNRRRAFDFLQRKGHSKAAIFSVFKKLGIIE